MHAGVSSLMSAAAAVAATRSRSCDAMWNRADSLVACKHAPSDAVNMDVIFCCFLLFVQGAKENAKNVKSKKQKAKIEHKNAMRAATHFELALNQK